MFLITLAVSTLNRLGFSDDLEARGGEEIRNVCFCCPWLQFLRKSLIYGLKWKFWSLLVCRINYFHLMLCSFVMRLLRRKLHWLFKFARSIFENQSFMTYMYIKWKQEIYRIQFLIKNQKIVTIFFEKKFFQNFSPQFWKKKFFSKLKIFKKFHITPQNHTIQWF